MVTLRHISQLPRLLKTLTFLGILLLAVAIVVLSTAALAAFTTLRAMVNDPQMTSFPLAVFRPLSLGMALAMMGAACAWPTTMYRARLRHPERVALPLETWQAQIAAALALAALPLCSLVFTLLFAPTDMLFTSFQFLVSAALNVIEAFLLLVATIWVFALTLG